LKRIHDVTDMDKPNMQCPSELTEVSAQALDNNTVLNIFISGHPTQVIMVAIQRVLRSMDCFLVDQHETDYKMIEKAKSISEMLELIHPLFTAETKVITI
jgi:hypothetical protein